MSTANDDPRCPECGEPIAATASYCMHCSADLDDWDGGDASGGGRSATSGTSPTGTESSTSGVESTSDVDPTDDFDPTASGTAGGTTTTGETGGGGLLSPDSFLDNALTVVVGIVGGIVVGIVATAVTLAVTGSLWALGFGFLTWLVATAYLVRRRTVQGAISKSAYAVALVLLSIPFVAVSPVFPVEGGVESRVQILVGGFGVVAVPAVFTLVVGWIAGRFVPEDAGGSEG